MASARREIYCQLAAAGVKCAYIDFDQIGFCRPAPDDDPDNYRVKARNLAAIWPNFHAAGARCLVVSGVIDTLDAVRMIVGGVPGTVLTLCRLRAGRADSRERILLRGPRGWIRHPG